MRLFAIGDIHGSYAKFERLLIKIKLSKRDTLVLLGDYINKGPQSKTVLDEIMALKNRGYRIVALRGNHEQILLNAQKNAIAHKLFIEKGGKQTLNSFNRNRLTDLPEKYFYFIHHLDFYYEQDDFIFVHGGFNEKIAQPFDDKYYMLWKCNHNYEHALLKEKTVVHGHCPLNDEAFQKQINNKTNDINLDTGCVYGSRGSFGRLTAFECYSSEVYQI